MNAILQQTAPASQAGAGGREVNPNAETERLERIVAALQTVYDPEIPTNIYDLGLVYAIDAVGENDIAIRMTLTAPGCPVAGEMPGWVENAVRTVEGVMDVEVSMVFDPPWTPERISPLIRSSLGL